MQSVIIYPLAGSIWGSPREYFGTSILFIIYMNDLPSCVTISKTLLFIDDTKIYNTVCSPGDISLFQNDLDSATLCMDLKDISQI